MWQWFGNWYDGKQKYRVLRGASWVSNSPGNLLSSYRRSNAPDYRGSDVGFRCVLADASSR